MSDPSAVSSAILGTALCIVCVSRKSGLPPLGVLRALAEIGLTQEIHEVTAPCVDCGTVTLTFQI